MHCGVGVERRTAHGPMLFLKFYIVLSILFLVSFFKCDKKKEHMHTHVYTGKLATVLLREVWSKRCLIDRLLVRWCGGKAESACEEGGVRACAACVRTCTHKQRTCAHTNV